ncbi:DUF7282 domain-containing protein [Natrinema pallidum]|uniref:DUF7282 domain-containing protein n=1 Tax=Natrinema pallidum DSM 3751 TaxID=1227495 RepID=L9Z6H6_9EURY|nr:hypothetical protein [Natrinema pallidum]ELY81496.1 hypothetical protein C487_03078 [Natrinema pallidum DSM 3751]
MVMLPRARTVGVAVIATLVLLSGASIAFAAIDASTAQDNETGNQTATVTFENQTSNGSAVVVNNTTLPEGGFAVIHAAAPVDENATDNMTADENETVTNVSEEYEPGAVLGNSSYLPSGDHENVTVELNDSLEESQVLIAMAHQDTNDNRTYEFPEADGPYTSDGEPVIDDALITLEDGMNETMADEMMDNETMDDEMRDDEMMDNESEP